MKRNITILLIILMLLMTSAVMAQDATTAPPDEPVATVEVVATEDAGETAEPTADATAEVVTATPQATPIVIIITDTPPVDPPPTPEPAASTDPMYYIIFAVVVGLFGLSAVDRWTNYKLSKTAISQVPPEWMPVIQQGLETAQRQVYERAGTLARTTPGTWDDNLLNEEMKRAGWELYIDPATGAQHARKIVTPAQPAG